MKFLLHTITILVVYSATAHAELVPFHTWDQSPFVSIYGLPVVGRPIATEPDQFSADVVLDVTSNYVLSQRGNERILIDFESYRTTALFRYGLNRDIELQAELPFISSDAGFLDSTINAWHDLFGFPDGGRDQAPKDVFRLEYERNGQLLVNQSSGDSGIGDVRLSVKYQLYKKQTEQTRKVTLQGTLKIPTGDDEKFFGSGAPDLALDIAIHERFPKDGRPWAWWGGLGLLIMGDSEILSQMQQSFGIYGGGGVGFYAWSPVLFKAQIDLHSAFYDDSRLRQLGDTAGQIVFGGSIRLAPKTFIDIGVAEDILVHTVPDVNFHLRLIKSF